MRPKGLAPHTLRRYHPDDKADLLKIIDQLTPHYFVPSERADYAAYLEDAREDYFVITEGGLLVGAGGINYFPKEYTARISWDLIHPAHQGKGLGRQLLQYRLAWIRRQPGIHRVVVRTTQLAHSFYHKSGFRLEKTERNFWAEGFDLYQMVLILDS